MQKHVTLSTFTLARSLSFCSSPDEYFREEDLFWRLWEWDIFRGVGIVGIIHIRYDCFMSCLNLFFFTFFSVSSQFHRALYF